MNGSEASDAIRGRTAAELVVSVRTLIDTGHFGAGAALPPIRALATRLGVNRNTVAAAYAQLAAAGVVESRGRGGTVVAGVPVLEGEGRRARAELVNLASGNPALEFLPDPSTAFGDGYVPPLYGASPVGDRLREWVDTRMAPDVEGAAHGLALTHGAVYAVERLLAAQLRRGDAVVVEDPCFLSSIGTMRLNGYRSVPVPVDPAGMDPDALARALEDGARAVVCTPRAHNPTGASVSAERASELRSVLQRHREVLVIEDDHFSMISTYDYHRITPVNAPRWALVRSVSKFLGPDLRLAFVLADPTSTSQLRARLSPAASWVSHILQHLVATMLDDETVGRLLEQARDSYASRHRALRNALADNGVDLPVRRDGLNVWIPVGGREEELLDALADRGWAVRGGGDFSLAGRGGGALRVTTASMTAHQATSFATDLTSVL